MKSYKADEKTDKRVRAINKSKECWNKIKQYKYGHPLLIFIVGYDMYPFYWTSSERGTYQNAKVFFVCNGPNSSIYGHIKENAWH